MDKKETIILALIVKGGRDRGFAGEYPAKLIKELNGVIDKMEKYNKRLAQKGE